MIVSTWIYLHIEETCATNGNKAVLKTDFIGSQLETPKPQRPTQIRVERHRDKQSVSRQSGFDIQLSSRCVRVLQ